MSNSASTITRRRRVWCGNLLLIFSIFLVLFLLPDREVDSLSSANLEELSETNSSSTIRDVRLYYHSLVKAIEDSLSEMEEKGHNASEMAFFCSNMRAHARRIARSHNPSLRHQVVSLFLQIRDSYTYGLRYLPHSLLTDSKNLVRKKSFFFSKTFLTLQQFRNCLVPLQNRTCPSYHFLAIVGDKSDIEILKSCTKTNRVFDKFSSA